MRTYSTGLAHLYTHTHTREPVCGDSRKSRESGATATSKNQHLRIPTSRLPVVYRRTQTRITGFPWRKGAWCTDRLKSNLLDTPCAAPGTRGENKYRPLHWHSSGRAEKDCKAHRQEKHGAAAGANRMGRIALRFGSDLHGYARPDIHGRFSPGRLLVLPQPEHRTVTQT